MTLTLFSAILSVVYFSPTTLLRHLCLDVGVFNYCLDQHIRTCPLEHTYSKSTWLILISVIVISLASSHFLGVDFFDLEQYPFGIALLFTVIWLLTMVMTLFKLNPTLRIFSIWHVSLKTFSLFGVILGLSVWAFQNWGLLGSLGVAALSLASGGLIWVLIKKVSQRKQGPTHDTDADNCILSSEKEVLQSDSPSKAQELGQVHAQRVSETIES